MKTNQMQQSTNDVQYRVYADFRVTMCSDFLIPEKDISEYFKNEYQGYNDCEFKELDRGSKETVVEEYLEFTDLVNRYGEWSLVNHAFRTVNELWAE